MSKEYRTFKSEVRAGKGAPSIEGYAAVFNSATDLGFFREQIAPGAFAQTIKNECDCRALFNHDPNLILGRTKNGTLQLSEDNTGLKIRCELNTHTTVGSDVHEMIKRGDVDGMSFGFTVSKESVDYSNPDSPLRTIQQAELFDVSPCVYPAYDATSVQARSIEEVSKELRAKKPADPDADSDNDPDNDSDAPCACRCRACFDADCRECDMHINDCQAENCDHEDGADGLNAGEDGERSKELRAEAKTLTVDGEKLTASCFLYVGDPDKTGTWALPWKFSSAAKTKSHLRNALARFNQTKTIPTDEKPAVWKKLVAKCKAYGIDVEGESKSGLDVETAKRRTYLNQISLI